jgi:hypothetical protein
MSSEINLVIKTPVMILCIHEKQSKGQIERHKFKHKTRRTESVGNILIAKLMSLSLRAKKHFLGQHSA